jgi:hypothetical protein
VALEKRGNESTPFMDDPSLEEISTFLIGSRRGLKVDGDFYSKIFFSAHLRTVIDHPTLHQFGRLQVFE